MSLWGPHERVSVIVQNLKGEILYNVPLTQAFLFVRVPSGAQDRAEAKGEMRHMCVLTDFSVETETDHV